MQVKEKNRDRERGKEKGERRNGEKEKRRIEFREKKTRSTKPILRSDRRTGEEEKNRWVKADEIHKHPQAQRILDQMTFHVTQSNAEVQHAGMDFPMESHHSHKVSPWAVAIYNNPDDQI